MLKLLAALALPAVVITGTGFTVRALTPDRVGSPWIVWDGRGFSNPDEFARWLDRRGVRYSTWARDHPQAAARLENRAPPAAEKKPQRPASGVPAAKATKTAASAAGNPTGRSAGHQLVLLALLALAAALVVISVLPLPLLLAIRAPAFVGDLRLELASAGVSIAIGIGAAQLLSGG